ncbi:MAG: Hsp70 family protein, partial [Microcystaceae cyanobacterium]
MSYAIDFGTSNTVVSRWNTAQRTAETLNLSPFSQSLLDNPPLIPSLVYVENAQTGLVIIGQEVRDRGLDNKNNPRFFKGFKRGIGSKIQGFLPELDGVNISFEQIGSWFLDGIVSQLQTSSETP